VIKIQSKRLLNLARQLLLATAALVFCLGSRDRKLAQATIQAEAQNYYDAAQKALAAGNYDEARRNYEKMSKLNPGIAEIHATLGAIYFQQKMFPQALQSLTEARRLKPGLPKLDGLIAMSLSELGRYDEALPGLETAFKTATEPPIQRMSGLQLERSYTALHRDSDAVAVALALDKLFPDDPEILYHDERIFGNYAFLTVQRLGKVAPDSVWRHQAQAEAEESQGAHEAAISDYRAIHAIDPERPGIHYKIGRALRERARDAHSEVDLPAAMEEFQSELKLDPHNASAAYEIGELHRLAGELGPAQTYFEAALSSYPDFPEANLGLGTVLAYLQKPSEALPYLKRAVANDPGDEATWFRLSQVERALGHVEEQKRALDEFKKLHGEGLAKNSESPRDVSRQQVEEPTPKQ
jgi:predicted Zn-dependent protease